MARKQTKKEPFWKQLNTNLQPFQREILSLLVLALAVITLLGLFSVTSGALSDWWTGLLRCIFGWGAYVVALGLMVAALTMLLSNLGQKPRISWRTIIGLEVLFIAGLALVHLLSFSQDPWQLAESGRGGGFVGWALSSLLIAALGWPIALLILLAILSLGLAMTVDPARIKVQVRVKAVVDGVLALYQRLTLRTEPPRRWPSGPGPQGEASTTALAPPSPEDVEQPTEIMVAEPEPETAVSAAQPQRQAKPEKRERPRSAKRRRVSLPPFDLLNSPSTQAFSQEETQRRARIIEQTLASFGVPAKVVEISQGPAVTQFGVKPGYIETAGAGDDVHRRKVRVSKITALANDLALALAASPIRIEAPVPGRSIVGIEVPNEDVSLVSLREVMESREFRQLDSDLKIALGRGVAGQAVVAGLAAMPHLLIAGATGSGKSVCINAITTCLVFNNPPEDLRLVMIDPKRVEMSRFKGLPHLLSGVEHEAERVIGVLKWIVREMEERYKRFAEAASRNLKDYNDKVKPDSERLPYIVVIIDELADLMLFAPEDIEWLICRIAQMARATGIHLIVATQRPSVDVVTGLIKANFPARISFAVTSQVDSRVILDSAGAESLLGEGDMLYLASDSSKLVRIQGCFVSDEEIKRVVKFWQERAEPDWLQGEAPWEELMEQEEADALLKEAIELVKEYNRASASFLQRKLHIGYPRAARIIDQLEERGVIGPPEDAGRSREVLVSQPDELSAIRDSGIRDL